MRGVVSTVVLTGLVAWRSISSAQTATPPPATATASGPEKATPPPATESGETTETNTLSGFLGMGYSYGFALGLGVGLRYQWVVVPKGFLHSLPSGMHDEFAIEPGFDYFHAGYSNVGVSWDYNEFTPLVGAMWTFWLNDRLAVYPKVDVGYRIASWSESVNGTSVGGGHADLFPVYIQGAGGAIYRFGALSLRGEVGWEDLRIGAGYTF